VNSPLLALGVRNFRLFFVAQIVSNIGTWFQSIAQTLLVIELTGSGKALGVVTALQFTPLLLFGLHGGVMADRIPARRMLIATSGLSALIAAALAVVTALDAVDIWQVWGLALAMGCVQAFDRPASQAFLYDLVGSSDLPKAAGLYSITQSAARMLGPALGGAAYAAFGSWVCFLINGVSFLFVAFALSMMRPGELFAREVGHETEKPRTVPAGEQVREGFRYAWQRPELRAPLLSNMLIGCLAFNFMVLIAAMTNFVFRADAAALGLAHALNAVGAVIGSLTLARVARPNTLHLAGTCFALALTILVNALAPNLLFFLLWAPIFGFTVGAYQTTLLSSVQRATDPSMLGRVSSLLMLGTVGTTPIGSMIVGFLIDAWSPRAGMALGALACVLGGALLLWQRQSSSYSAPRMG
jgi:MFS family permease